MPTLCRYEAFKVFKVLTVEGETSEGLGCLEFTGLTSQLRGSPSTRISCKDFQVQGLGFLRDAKGVRGLGAWEYGFCRGKCLQFKVWVNAPPTGHTLSTRHAARARFSGRICGSLVYTPISNGGLKLPYHTALMRPRR